MCRCMERSQNHAKIRIFLGMTKFCRIMDKNSAKFHDAQPPSAKNSSISLDS